MERMITDSRGQRWDVSQPASASAGDTTFRHQSGRELHADLRRSIDELSSDQLLSALDDARRNAGLDEVGHGGLDVSFDAEGYETGRRE